MLIRNPPSVVPSGLCNPHAINEATVSSPTEEAYSELQYAYNFFNARLFGGDLPPCLLTLQSKHSRSHGYFSPQRFNESKGKIIDEIAMNPKYFRTRDTTVVLSTLVHEMVHLWHKHFCQSGRGGYHDKKWGEKMKQVGLHPSNTGLPGGRETGYQMTHYIVSCGPFEKAAQALIAEEFTFTWAERGVKAGTNIIAGAKSVTDDQSNRVKYTCPACQINAWGKPHLLLLCGSCSVRLASPVVLIAPL